MGIDAKRVCVFLLFLLAIFYFFMRYFEKLNMALFAVFCFTILYIFVLYFIKLWHGLIFKNTFSTYAENIDASTILDIEPYVRGVIFFNNLKLFSRVAIGKRGLYLYKQGAYSLCFPWRSISLREETFKGALFVRVCIQRDRNCQFLIPWNEALAMQKSVYL